MIDLSWLANAEVAVTTNPVINKVSATVKGHPSGSGTVEYSISVEQLPDVSIVKTSDYQTYYDGDAIKYTITLTNNKVSAAEQIVVTDVLPDEVTITKVSLNGIEILPLPIVGSTVTVNIPSIPGTNSAPNNKATIVLEGTVHYINI